MNLGQTLIIVLILGFSNEVISQTWIQNEAKWIFPGAAYGGTYYNKFFTEGDTVFQEKSCVKIFKENVFIGVDEPDSEIIDTVTILKKEYYGLLCENNDSIYFKPKNEDIRMIFDFSMQVGESIFVDVGICEESSYELNLVEYESQQINDLILRSQKFMIIVDSNHYYFQDTITILEGVGLLDDVAGHHPFQYGALGCFNYSPIYMFDCFSSSEIEYPINSNCKTDFELITQVQNINNENLDCYPNPTNGLIFINSEEEVKEVEIYNSNGKKLMVEKNDVRVVDLNNLKNGIYLLKIVTNDRCYVKKMIKKGT